MYIDFSGNYTVQENLAQAEIKNLRSAVAILQNAKAACDEARVAVKSGEGKAAEALDAALSQRARELNDAVGEVSSLAAEMENALAKYAEIDRKARAEFARQAAERERQAAAAQECQPEAIGAVLLGMFRDI